MFLDENGQVRVLHQYSTVSSRHFTEDDFKTDLKKTLLQPSAVPSVIENYPLHMQKLNQGGKKTKNCKIAQIPAKNSNMVKNALFSDTYEFANISHLNTSKDVLTSKVKKLKNTSYTSINKNNVTILNLQNVKCCSKNTEDQTMSSSSENISDVSATSSITNFESENSNIPVDVQSSNMPSDSNTNSNNLNAYKDISVLEVDNNLTKSVAVNTEVTVQQLNEQDNEIYTLREKLRLAKRALNICKDKIRELEKVNRKLIGMS